MLLFKTDNVSGDTGATEEPLTDVLVVFINDEKPNHYLVPFSVAEAYLPADGHIIGLVSPEDCEDPDTAREQEVLIQHFALLTGEEPCFLPAVPSLAEYIEIQKDGPGVLEESGVKACGAPGARYKVKNGELKGQLKHVERVLTIGWLL